MQESQIMRRPLRSLSGKEEEASSAAGKWKGTKAAGEVTVHVVFLSCAPVACPSCIHAATRPWEGSRSEACRLQIPEQEGARCGQIELFSLCWTLRGPYISRWLPSVPGLTASCFISVICFPCTGRSAAELASAKGGAVCVGQSCWETVVRAGQPEPGGEKAEPES